MKWTVPFALLLALTGCVPEPQIPGAFVSTGEVEVTVNGAPVTRDMLEAIISHMPKSKQEALLGNPEKKKQFLDAVVTSNLLYREALEVGLHKEDDVQRALAMATREILANLQLSRIGDAAVTDENIQAKYNENKVKYGRPATHFHHFMVREKDKATRLVEEIKNGAEFADIARKNDPRTRSNGGDNGWTNRAPIPDLEDVYNTAPINELMGPIESRMGFHILKIEARRDKTPIEDVREQLEQMVKVDAMKAHQLDVKVKADMQWGTTNAPAAGKSMTEDTPSDPTHGKDDGHNHEAH